MIGLAVLAITCAGLFAGAAVYITLVEHPARLECGTDLALAEFAPSYRRATMMQASLAIVGCVAALGAWVLGAATGFLIAAVLIGAVVPFTLVVLYPVNARLLAPGLAAADAEDLLVRWGRLHALRSGAGLVAFLVEIVAVALD